MLDARDDRKVPIVTDGSAWRPGGSTQGSSPWWSDALSDPWRDPAAPAAVVIRTPAGAAPASPAPPATVELPARRGLGLIFLIVLVTALLAGALGGTLGFVFAGGGGRTVLGTNGSGNAAP